MKRRIIAAAVSILLAVSFVLNLPLPATADTWDETIAHYDRVFAVIDGEPEASLLSGTKRSKNMRCRFLPAIGSPRSSG